MSDESAEPNELPGVDQGQATDESIINTHAQMRRDPIAASPVGFFTAMALIVVVVFGWFYLRRYFAEQDPALYLTDREQIANFRAYDPTGGLPVEIDMVALGAELYTQQCVACHQTTGLGMPGAFPPLAQSEWVTTEDPTLPIKILLSGLSGPIVVKGNPYNGAMPAFGAAWDDTQIAAVVSHIRSSWENGASEVTPEQVAEVRSETGTRGPWTAEELSSYFQ